jgi:hypothetical protein
MDSSPRPPAPETTERAVNDTVARLWARIIREWEGGSFLWCSGNYREFRHWEPPFAAAVAEKLRAIASPFHVELIQAPEGPAVLIKGAK